MFSRFFRPRHSAAQHFFNSGTQATWEALMAGMRSDRARARARHLLATIYPIPDDVQSYRLRELAIDYIREAERLEAENNGRTAEPDEVITAALDAVARDYFTRVLKRLPSRKER
jgi:hypothetical protein